MDLVLSQSIAEYGRTGSQSLSQDHWRLTENVFCSEASKLTQMLALWAVYFGKLLLHAQWMEPGARPMRGQTKFLSGKPTEKRDLVWMGPTIPSDNIPKKSLFHDDFLEVNNFSSGGVNRDCLYPMTNQNFGILLKL